jgi:nicotinate phosphoribosyltransferase
MPRTIAQGTNMPGERFFSASDEEIRKGRTTDVYFERTMQVLKANHLDRLDAHSEFTASSLPRQWPWGVLAGVEEVARLMAGKDVDISCLPEGTVFRNRDRSGLRVPIMTISGPYGEYCIYETPMLGFICFASGVATSAARCHLAAEGKPVLSFGVRRMHPALSPVIDRSAYIGGCDSASSLLGAELVGQKPTGTMPHALIIMFGDSRKAFAAFGKEIEEEARTALVDTFCDEKAETVMALESMPGLRAVRLDTPASRRGDICEIVREVKWELACRGHPEVRVLISGGLGEADLPNLVKAGADGFGVGTSIANSPTIDFAMDIVEKDGKAVSKRGKLSGRKEVFHCPDCIEYAVQRPGEKVPCCSKCGSEMTPALRPLMKGGKRVGRAEKEAKIRARTLKQLDIIKEAC